MTDNTKNSKRTDLLATPMRQFIAATASRQPTPGGGSVAGVVGALGAALGEMALAYTRGKKRFAANENLYNRLTVRLARMRGMFEDLVADDVEAFGLYHAASQMSDGPEKDEATQLALAAAINVPREMAKLSLAMLDDLASLADKCNPYLISDLTAAAALAAVTVRLCDYNVRINAPQLTDRQAAEDIGQASRDDLDRACRMLTQIEETAGTTE